MMLNWDLYAHSPAAFIFVMAVFGSMLASFGNVVIYRLPIMLWSDNPDKITLNHPRSSCPHCHSAIRWYHNIPVIGWLWLLGRCLDCKTHIPFRYLLIELSGAILGGVCASIFLDFSITLAAMLLALSVIINLVIYYRHRRVSGHILTFSTVLLCLFFISHYTTFLL